MLLYLREPSASSKTVLRDWSVAAVETGETHVKFNDKERETDAKVENQWLLSGPSLSLPLSLSLTPVL